MWHSNTAFRRFELYGSQLPPRLYDVFTRAYGIGRPQETLSSLAREYGLSFVRIRQLRLTAEWYLRRAAQRDRWDLNDKLYKKLSKQNYRRKRLRLWVLLHHPHRGNLPVARPPRIRHHNPRSRAPGNLR